MCIDSVILLVLVLAIEFFRSFRHCEFQAQARVQDFIVAARAKGRSCLEYKRAPCRLSYLAILSSISILWVSFLNIEIRELKGDKSINLF